MTDRPRFEETPDEIFAHEEEPFEPHVPSPAVRPKGPHLAAFEWIKANLFSSVPNTLLTLFGLWLLWQAIPPMLDWALFSAVWHGDDPTLCRQAGGACWAFVEQKHRFILFGLYPWDEQWRPLLAVCMFIAALVTTCCPRFWKPWLAGMWIVVFAACALLMWGGVLGMTFVDTGQWGGLPLTLILSVVGMVCSFPLAILLALGRRSDLPAIRSVCVGFIEFVRGVPLVSVLFMASVMFPLFLPEGVTINKLLRAQVGIILFTAAYLAEAVRGGLQAVPRGQYEAADAIGLGYWQKMGLIILPQALKVSIPPLVNQFISMFKDTSLVIIIGLFDLLTTAKTAVAEPQWRPFFVESYVFVAMIYWSFCFFMSRYSQFLERLMDTGHRRT
ncbi:MAG: amino acid ABC transporter permease [Rhodospirillales bacterium]|nr:amino acid ABC transporter permease [Rhodospirillales bacterium]